MSGIKIEEAGGRCGRDTEIHTDSVKTAQAVLKTMEKKKQRAKEIEDFLSKIPVGELPDLVLYTTAKADASGTRSIIHTHLCYKDETEGRSCLPRVAELVDAVDTLPERKKPVRKTKTET